MEKPVLNDAALYYLAEVRRWAKFIAILSFIGLGFMVIAGFFMGFVLSVANGIMSQPMPFPPLFFTVFYIILAVVYFFPVYYLYRFSEDLGKALSMGSEPQLTSAFRFLKSHYKFIGILIIVSIAFGILLFFASIMAGLFGFFAATGL